MISHSMVEQGVTASGRERLGPRAFLAFAVAAALLGLLAIAGCGTPAPTDSGIEGEVRIGPVSPVETVETPSSKPYSTELTIRPQRGPGLPVRVTSGQDGRFRLNLAPGSYVIEPAQGNPLPTASPLTVVVEAHRFTSVVVEYDSGIR